MLRIKRRVNIEAFFSAFERSFDKNFSFEGERHNFWELVYVVDGVIGAAEDDKIYKLQKGDIIFHMPMEFHRLWASDGTSPRAIILSFSLSGTDFGVLDKGVFNISKEDEALLKEAVRHTGLCREYEDSQESQIAALNVERLMLNIIKNQTPDVRQQKTKGPLNYSRIINVMNENIEKNLCAEEIASLCGLSLSNLKKIFKNYSGVGVMDYFNNLKITKAMTMINEGVPIYEISDALGFSSPNYFSECFKKRSGLTPTEYKRRFGGREFL
ncbi:MAG: helix-turn-helix transcriptional regulator [Clostridia bacterium]|nr:helix-turn-helix transcriptional regulator [Clostridia bacterium]